VTHFVEILGRRLGRQIEHIPAETMSALSSYHWPGNIRELQNLIERAVILSNYGVLPNPLAVAGTQTVANSPAAVTVSETENFSVDGWWLSRQPPAAEPNSGLGLFRRLPSQEKAIIEAALRDSGGQVYGPAGAASKLGVSTLS
jgi:transcriptional regulator with GAF, ATPase, and Fis domain